MSGAACGERAGAAAARGRAGLRDPRSRLRAAAPAALPRRTDASCRTAREGEVLANKPGVCVLHQLLLPYFNSLVVSSG